MNDLSVVFGRSWIYLWMDWSECECWFYFGSIFILFWNFNKLVFVGLFSCFLRIKVGVFKDCFFYILNGFLV